jgi:predicted RNase H-like HicB family nuclease
LHYLAFVFPDATGFGFTCADIPGFAAHVETDDLDTAVEEARAVLTAHLATLIDAGGELPCARSLTTLCSDSDLADDFSEAAATILLPALVPAGRTLRVNLSFDENTLGLIDGAARVRGLTRSAFLAEAARGMI